ncbi:MAG TPA: phosphopantetheine-binding protein, partial [Chitinispirillaceae bacterium]|nr:phosphopantetheine-binding protein [Chitinispirillaceae bacterium]
DEMDPDAPLFGTGIDLDSIDAVEIVMIIENEFGIKLRSIVETRSLRTINTLTDAIMKSEASYVN